VNGKSHHYLVKKLQVEGAASVKAFRQDHMRLLWYSKEASGAQAKGQGKRKMNTGAEAGEDQIP
jgi:hypothetical protein